MSDKRRNKKKNNERKFYYCRRLRVCTLNVLVLVLVMCIHNIVNIKQIFLRRMTMAKKLHVIQYVVM